MELMCKPVTLSDGTTYDEDEVRAWLNKGNRTSPLTGKTLPSLHLKPNVDLRRRIVAWVQAREARKAPPAALHAPAVTPAPAPMPVSVQAMYVPPALRRGAADAERKGAALDMDKRNGSA